jgi:hypothetical protein
MEARSWTALRLGLIVVAVAGLAVDAYVHFDLASGYAAVRTSTLSQADLFRAEGVAAIVAAVGLIVRPRRYTAAFAFLVAAAGTAAVLVYRYVDVGAFGPFPNMYEPIWYTKKTVSAWAEGIAAVAALALLVLLQVRSRTVRAARVQEAVR